MPDQMTTTSSIGGPVSAVTEAIETLRQALLDEGKDPGTVEAILHMAKPTETNLVGNYADLQRLGAIVTTGTLPTPPTEEDITTSNLEDAFVTPQPADVDEVESGDTGTMTKAELQAELDSRGIEYPSSATKADLQALLG